MTVSTTTRKAGPFIGDGVATVFPFVYKVFAKTDLQVVLTDAAGAETVLELDADYSVTLNADQDNDPGGTVTYSYGGIPLPSTQKLTILSDVPLLQPTDIQNRSGFYPSVIEDALDRVTILAQQAEELLGRAVRFAVSDGATNAELPTAAERANKAIVFDENGNIAVSEAGWQVEVTQGNVVRTTHVKGVDFVAGGTTLFLPSDGFIKENVHILFDGAEQQQTEFTLNGATVTLNSPIPSDVAQIETWYIQPLAVGSINDGVVTDAKVAADAGIDANKLNFVQAGAGAMVRTVRTKLREQRVTPDDFGANKTGGTNTTTALLNFFNYVITNGVRAHIPAGSYLVDEGVLAFDTPFVDKSFPDITTDGHNAVFFIGSGAANAPLLTFTNGTATSGTGRYWRGGQLGGITFVGSAGGGTSKHGLSLRGMWGTKFGWMVGSNLTGDLFNFPQALYGGTNPDPYAVSFATFEGVEANGCRFAVNNLNYLGLDSAHFKSIRAIGCTGGVFYGSGSGLRIDEFSVGSCAGWAFDDGTHVDALGGAPSRVSIGLAEFDDVQYGLRLNRTTLFDFEQIRFVHRYNFSSLNTSNSYWPRIAIDLVGGASPNIYMGRIQVVHRIEAGGTKAGIGVFVQGNNNGNVTGLDIDQQLLDNAGLGFVNADLFTNISLNASLLIKRVGRIILDLRDKAIALGRGSASTTVPNSGWGTSAAKISFPTSQFVTASTNYDPATSTFTAPARGMYRFMAAIPLTLAAGNRVRIGVFTSGNGLECATYQYAVGSGVQTYTLDATVILNAGDTAYIMADQNTASATVAAAIQTNNNECRLTVLPF